MKIVSLFDVDGDVCRVSRADLPGGPSRIDTCTVSYRTARRPSALMTAAWLVTSGRSKRVITTGANECLAICSN